LNASGKALVPYDVADAATLAVATGIPDDRIATILRGDDLPNIIEGTKIARVLEYDGDELLNFVPGWIDGFLPAQMRRESQRKRKITIAMKAEKKKRKKPAA
jgi:hypothetical protein